jgi:hypothetical protein
MTSDDYQLKTVHLSHNIILTTLTKLVIGLAITSAHRMIENLENGHSRYTHVKMEYQYLILDFNDGGIKNPDYYHQTSHHGSGRNTYLVYKGLPCYQCRLLIPLHTRVVRRRAGNTSKYLHISCYERVHQTRIPLITEAEQAAARMNLYPAMGIPLTR